jgi:nucleoside-diphosphate-sugar epimerase
MTAQKKKTSSKKPVVLITGGAGFLGRALKRELAKEDPVFDCSEIRIFDARNGDDVRSYSALKQALRGVDVVFHCASLVSWGQFTDNEVHAVNVSGTGNVIRACTENGVKALVYTSTLDAIFDGTPVKNGDESIPYPDRFHAVYPRTKAIAEQMTVRADGLPLKTSGKKCPALRTSVIRPCGMWGEYDPYHVPNILKMAKLGPLSFRIGDKRAHFQHVYVGNVAHAHLLAARALLAGDPNVGGQVYLVTDFPARPFLDYYEPIVNALGYRLPPKWKTAPLPLMYRIAGATELFASLLRPVHRFTPLITRLSLDLLSKDFTFVSHKAERDLGYAPVYSEQQALDRTIEHFRGIQAG